MKEAIALCDTLSDAEDELTREIVSRLAEKWTMWTLVDLATAPGPLRFSRIMEHVDGVSQKSLTKALRQLERDGLVTRKVFAEVPPRVEYTVTPLALEMMRYVEPLWIWVAKSVKRFQIARTEYDAQGAPISQNVRRAS